MLDTKYGKSPLSNQKNGQMGIQSKNSRAKIFNYAFLLVFLLLVLHGPFEFYHVTDFFFCDLSFFFPLKFPFFKL